MVAAQPGTDEPARQEGTSLAAPLMTGFSALMMSLQLQRGEQPNAEAVRMAFLNSAIPCDPQEVAEPERCLVGKLNIPGAYQLLTGQPLPGIKPQAAVPPQIICQSESQPVLDTPESAVEISADSSAVSQLVTASATIADISPVSLTPATITPSAVSKKVYALGTLGFDFGSEARRDTFKQRMPAVNIDGVLVSPNPYDASQMVNHLELSPDEGKSLIWTLNQELTPI